ncbi:hypothetical protein Psch_03534 [Pelotomaculum schinkii]|uniref:Uncharacterized protein n=1 Tax=Pelotomaculum schinkii TaxID=78350 RepID=A0A4Y7R7N7_9FIRM|nr:hypothetical protein [Pelotomaculum schinkii]TEB04772.1 hypothetical protein Psch_03534 [Pelotomaculum schinkii]
MAGDQKTIGIRGTLETEAKYEELRQLSGLNKKEFLEMLLSNYESNKARESMGQVKELENLSHHLARIEETYVSLVKAGQDRDEAYADKIASLEQETLQSKAAALEAKEELQKVAKDAQVQVDAAKAEAALARETAAKEVQEAKEALSRSLDAQEKLAKLANLAEEAAATAKAKVSELEEKAGLVGQLEVTVEQLKAERDDLTGRLEKTKEDYERQLERAKAEKENSLLKLENELRNDYEERNRQAVAAVETKAEERVRRIEAEVSTVQKKAEEKLQKAEDEIAAIREKAEKQLSEIREALDRERQARLLAERNSEKASEAAAEANSVAEALQEKANLADRYLKDRNDLEARLQQALVDKDKSLLAQERESMNEISRLREELAQVREDKAALEVLMARAGGKQPVPETVGR